MSPILYRAIRHDSSIKPKTNKAIVLDLDETLVHTGEDIKELHNLGIMSNPKLLPLRKRIYIVDVHEACTRKGTGECSKMWGIARPHLEEFLRFCFEYFEYVIIWSAGRDRYVKDVVNKIFFDLREPHLIYTWNHLKEGRVVQKPLAKIFEDPIFEGRLNLTNTLIVDDRETAFTLANPENGIKIPVYAPEPEITELSADENSLKQLMSWLSRPEVENASDIRSLDKSKIFSA